MGRTLHEARHHLGQCDLRPPTEQAQGDLDRRAHISHPLLIEVADVRAQILLGHRDHVIEVGDRFMLESIIDADANRTRQPVD
jgi:hypothetical protein